MLAVCGEKEKREERKKEARDEEQERIIAVW
jgi:hypothetical protein